MTDTETNDTETDGPKAVQLTLRLPEGAVDDDIERLRDALDEFVKPRYLNRDVTGYRITHDTPTHYRASGTGNVPTIDHPKHPDHDRE